MIEKLFFYFLFLIIQPIFCNAFPINLEENTQEYIKDIQRIYIPEHPFAFNPSFIQWEGSLLMCFREIIEVESDSQSRIGIIKLDKQFNPISTVQFLDFGADIFGLEDARLITIGSSLYLVYSAGCKDLPPTPTNGSGANCRMYFAELIQKDGMFFIKNNTCLSQFKNENPHKNEKNWIPFEYDNNLLFAYSIYPHLIFQSAPGENECKTFACSTKKPNWEWGEIRGGTPAILSEDHYVSFFHSSIPLSTIHSEGEPIPHYFIGGYTFSFAPPFEIQLISPFPLIGNGFYSGDNYQPYWHPVRVVFPCGLISDGEFFWISYGRQDHEMWVAKIDKNEFYKSLDPI